MRIEPVHLGGEHVVLEPLTRAHLGPLASVLDPKLLQWFPKPITNDAELAEFIEEALHAQDAGTALPFATIDRARGKVIGSTRFANIDCANRKLEIGWTWIARPWQRSAINTEAKLLMLQHAFETLGAIRVQLKTDLRNLHSQRAIEKLGAVREGVLRRYQIRSNGEVRDTVMYSVLAEEWPALKARLEARLADL